MDFRDGDVPDSTDWLGTSLACLMPLEQALRCHVCKDFYNSPMITSCNHTFCSLCIRRSLSVDGKCPLCRMLDQESKLRGNWALREAIDAFCRARPTVLAAARRPEVVWETPPTQKRKADEEDEESPAPAAAQSATDAPQAKRTRTSARLSKTKAAKAVASIAEDEMSVEDAEERGKKGSPDSGDTDYEPDDGLVACPICQKRMKLALINSHLDSSCSGSPQKPKKPAFGLARTGASASTWRGEPSTSTTTAAATTNPSNPFGATPVAAPRPPPPERLPSVSYSLLTDVALRKKMALLGLTTSGARLLLERRHKEWTTIWNANCDSARPKRRAELLHDIDIWERTVGVLAGGGGGSGGGGSAGAGMARTNTLASRAVAAAHQQAAQIKDKDFDGVAWSAKHSTSFRDLIANARKSRIKQEATGDADGKPEDEKAAADDPETRPQGTSAVPERSTKEQPPDALTKAAASAIGKENSVVEASDVPEPEAETPNAAPPGDAVALGLQ